MGLGDRIKQARIAKKLTQKELATLIDVTASAITNYETNVSSPRIETMYKLFDVLDVDANFLYQDEMTNICDDDSTKKATPEEIESSLINVFSKYDMNGLSDKKLELIDKLITAVIESDLD